MVEVTAVGRTTFRCTVTGLGLDSTYVGLSNYLVVLTRGILRR